MVKYIRTQTISFYEKGQLDLKKYIGCMDLAFVNVGGSVCTIQPSGGVETVLQPGDPMLTWGGYEGFYRNDSINIDFVGGTGELKIDLTIHTNFAQCYPSSSK